MSVGYTCDRYSERGFIYHLFMGIHHFLVSFRALFASKTEVKTCIFRYFFVTLQETTHEAQTIIYIIA